MLAATDCSSVPSVCLPGNGDVWTHACMPMETCSTTAVHKFKFVLDGPECSTGGHLAPSQLQPPAAGASGQRASQAAHAHLSHDAGGTLKHRAGLNGWTGGAQCPLCSVRLLSAQQGARIVRVVRGSLEGGEWHMCMGVRRPCCLALISAATHVGNWYVMESSHAVHVS